MHERNEALLPPSRRVKDNLRALFAYVEQHPIYTIGGAAEALGISYNSAASLTKKLVELNILEETTNGAAIASSPMPTTSPSCARAPCRSDASAR